MRDLVKEEIRRICNGVAVAHGCEVNVEIIDMYPATLNHPENAKIVREVAAKELGEE